MDSNENPIIAGAQRSQPQTTSLTRCAEPGALSEAQQRIQPAPQELVVRGLSSALVLVAPAGFSDGDRRAWLTSAAMTLKGIPADLLERGVVAARRVADHPSKIVPAIMEAIGTSWELRRDNARREVASEVTALPAPESDVCTPEQAAEIMAEFGLATNPLETVRRHIGPPVNPPQSYYLDMGVDPKVFRRA